MAKNNQKKEKALRNKENARKYRKKTPFGRGGRPGGRPSAAPAAMPSTSAAPPVAPSVT